MSAERASGGALHVEAGSRTELKGCRLPDNAALHSAALQPQAARHVRSYHPVNITQSSYATQLSSESSARHISESSTLPGRWFCETGS